MSLLNYRCIIFDKFLAFQICAKGANLFLQSMVQTQNCMETLFSPLHNVMDLNMGVEDTFITVTLGQKRRDMFLRRAALHESGIVSRWLCRQRGQYWHTTPWLSAESVQSVVGSPGPAPFHRHAAMPMVEECQIGSWLAATCTKSLVGFWFWSFSKNCVYIYIYRYNISI